MTVREVQRGCHLGADVRCHRRRKVSLPRDEIGQRPPGYVLHHDEVHALGFAGIEHRHDVRMRQARRCESLPTKPGHRIRLPIPRPHEDLHRHLPLQAQVLGDEDLGHPASGQKLIQSVPAVENRSRPQLSQTGLSSPQKFRHY